MATKLELVPHGRLKNQRSGQINLKCVCLLTGPASLNRDSSTYPQMAPGCIAAGSIRLETVRNRSESHASYKMPDHKARCLLIPGANN